MAEIAMPRLSDSMEEGSVVRWLVAEGAEVAAGEEIVEIETDKATMTFESEHAGTLHTAVAAGETVAVGVVIAHVLAAGEEIAPIAADAELAPAESVAAPAGLAVAPAVADNGAGKRRAKASPVARRVAAALGVELTTLSGSGPQGRIVKRDVEAAAAENGAGAAAPAQAAPPSEVRFEQPSRVQATIARRMAEAKSTMPEFTLSADVDMDAAVAMRVQIKELGSEQPAPSFNDFVVRACALALREHPRANGAYRDGRFELYPRVNVGVAVAADDALLVPVVSDADRRSLGEIAVETRRLAARARDGALTAAELSGGTFSVSNLGMFGISSFTAVLNPPQAAILAVGALEQRPIARDGAPAIGHRMTVTLTCDHRILYGADAARFLADVRAGLEQPLRLTL
jgi:pyruvate dehydrogenase E2 component (dihydrolipoamide acetyltransferase)